MLCAHILRCIIIDSVNVTFLLLLSRVTHIQQYSLDGGTYYMDPGWNAQEYALGEAPGYTHTTHELSAGSATHVSAATLPLLPSNRLETRGDPLLLSPHVSNSRTRRCMRACEGGGGGREGKINTHCHAQ